jgi:hypothetical protein
MFNVSGPTQGLKSPSNILIDMTKLCLKIFNEQFLKIKHEKQIVYNLMEISEKKKNNNILDFRSSHCKEHYLYIIELLLEQKFSKSAI